MAKILGAGGRGTAEVGRTSATPAAREPRFSGGRQSSPVLLSQLEYVAQPIARGDGPRLDVEFEIGQLAVLFTVGGKAAVVEREFFRMQSRSVPRNIQQGFG